MTVKKSDGEKPEEKLIDPRTLAEQFAMLFPEKRVVLKDTNGEVEFQSIPAPDKTQ